MRPEIASESKLLERLRELNPKMALSQIMTARTESTRLVPTKFGKSPQGSFASYQLSVTEDNFKVFCDISSVNRSDSDNHVHYSQLTACPIFPLRASHEQFQIPTEISGDERCLLEKIPVNVDELNEIERKTREQSTCQEWKEEGNLGSLPQILALSGKGNETMRP